MSNKYIIKNCPCFSKENEEVNDYTCSWGGTEELACQDCTDCVLKQIVELCNIPNCLCDNCDGVGYFDGCVYKDCAFYRIMQIQAKLEIEEVE